VQTVLPEDFPFHQFKKIFFIILYIYNAYYIFHVTFPLQDRTNDVLAAVCISVITIVFIGLGVFTAKIEAGSGKFSDHHDTPRDTTQTGRQQGLQETTQTTPKQVF